MKKVISAFLAIIMLCNLTLNSEFLAFASTSGELGNGINYSFDDSVGELVLSGQGKVGQIYNGWQNYQTSDIKSVVIKNGITGIGEAVFANCVNLENVTLSNTVTEIEDNAFSSCSSLKNLTLSTNLSQIGNEAFSHCEKLERVVLPNALTKLGNMAFLACSSLENLKLSTSLLQIGDSAFSGCNSLENIILPDTLTELGKDAFDGCERLKTVTLSNSLTSVKPSTFGWCKSLESISFPQSVKEIGEDAFYKCSNLNKISFSNNLINIGKSAFAECLNLQEVVLPNNLENIGEFAFYNCTNLKKLSLPKSLTQIGECAFEFCNLSYVYVPNNNAHIGKYAFLSDNENPIILCNSTVQFDDDYNTVYYIDKSVPVRNFKDLYQSNYDFNNTLLYSFTANESGTYFSGGEGWYPDSNYMKIFDENYNLVESQKIESISEDEYNPTGGFSFNLEKGHTYYFPYGGDYENNLEIIKDYQYFENGKQYIQGDMNYACLKVVYPDDSFELEKYYGMDNEDLSQPITLQHCGKTITFSLNDPVTFDSFEVLNSECIDEAFIAEFKEYDYKALEKYHLIYRLHLSNGKTYDINNYSMWCGSGGATEPNGISADYICDLDDGRQFDIQFTYYNNEPNKLEICVNNKYFVSSPSLTIEINNQQPPQPQPTSPTQPTVPTQPTTPTPTQPTQATTTQAAVTKPKKAKIKKVKGYKKALEVSYAKVSGASGYQIQVATDKKFKKNKKTVTAKKSKTKVKISKLKKKKKYYVRVRAYKSASGKKVYGAWSKVKTVKTK